jgi:hypothetical protein
MNTPAPWEVLKLGGPLKDYSAARFIVRARRGAPGGIAVIMGGLGADEEEGNAYLIGAALEMRDTLQTIAELAVGHGDVCELIARRARAALAKAYPPPE